jgi:hypothetical protein
MAAIRKSQYSVMIPETAKGIIVVTIIDADNDASVHTYITRVVNRYGANNTA